MNEEEKSAKRTRKAGRRVVAKERLAASQNVRARKRIKGLSSDFFDAKTPGERDSALNEIIKIHTGISEREEEQRSKEPPLG